MCQAPLTVDERDPAHSHVTVTIDTTSLDTKRPARDTHLRSADFFDVARSPTMTFTSQHVEALDQAAGHYRVTGTLTIREMSHEVSLDTWHVSPASTEEGRLTLTATAVLDRRDWGLTWKRPIQQIADEVHLALTVQFLPASSD